MTLSEVTGVSGSEGNFTVSVKEHPRYVDMNKCIACGECATKCPKKVNDTYNASTKKRKAIYVKYSQAVPLKYQIDADQCIYIQKPGKCGFCAKVCPADAINFEDTEKHHEIQVGSIILAPGFQPFDPKDAGIWGYGTLPNVITSMQLERYCSATGPTEGHLIRPSDGKPARKVAFLQCVGSRDENKCGNSYCSSVCCMYAIKEAAIAKDHIPGLQTTIFFMDMRTHGKDFDRYYQRAKLESGFRFIRCRVHGVEAHGKDVDLRLHYINEEGRQVEEYYDMVVLSVGLQTPKPVVRLAKDLGIQLTSGNFAATSNFMPVLTSKPGIFTCGAFAGPKDIPQSVIEGSAAAAGAGKLLATSRNTLTRDKTFPAERDTSCEEPKIGVFVCHCGSNIAGVVDVAAVSDYAATLPGVAHVERNLFTCSQDTQDLMVNLIKEKGLNRIVVAACTPRTHEPLFRETLKAAGINEYLFEMANIRNQNSWVHANEPAKATAKAKDLIRMAVAKVSPQFALHQLSVPVTRAALVIGGGLAGMTSALNLADQGFPVHLVEKSDQLGGFARMLDYTWKGDEIKPQLANMTARIENHYNITLHLQTEVKEVEGYVGNFRTTVQDKSGNKTVIEHGAGIVATGGKRYRPLKEYGYGEIKGVYTGIEFDVLRKAGDINVREGKTFVFIQCVGSRQQDRPYCSKVCCTHSVQSAIRLKKEDATRKVYILYRDIRTYGEREALYKEARQLGVVFVNYELHGKPLVKHDMEGIQVEVWDHVLHRPLFIDADVVILAEAILANQDAKKLAQLFKIPVDGDGFFQEAHAKLRPVDFVTDGLFVAGLAHYPKPVEESIAQAMAAAARAATLLSKESITLEAIKATVVEDNCDGCALCLDVCPFSAISLTASTDADGRVSRRIAINKAQCKGCGLCQGTCPKRGVFVAGFSLDQINKQVAAALAV
ncbi:MAG: CoB--CoM heterodisulfide reductase iron-sulfur subunit A family protein [Desulfobacterales bacterium]|nr:MAG: CoB--CoM heterodisulfide reductase iron-sulfur subunit A family protein [Desulfobacterales bacterium]